MPKELQQFGFAMCAQMKALTDTVAGMQSRCSPTKHLQLDNVRASIAGGRLALADAGGPASTPPGNSRGVPAVEEVAETSCQETEPPTPLPPPDGLDKPQESSKKKARLSVADASKLILTGYINKDTRADEARPGAARAEGVGADKGKVSKNPLGLMRR